jgi:hypothetical protein
MNSHAIPVPTQPKLVVLHDFHTVVSVLPPLEAYLVRNGPLVEPSRHPGSLKVLARGFHQTVVPLFNEEENVCEMYQGLTRALVSFGVTSELAFIDAGVMSSPPAVLSELPCRKGPRK